MAKRARLADIAREAGVGTATVERVLNARGNVAPATVERVVLAARRLGHDRQLPAPYHGLFRIEVILMRPDTPFFARLNQAFIGIAAALDRSVVIHRTFLDELDPESVAEHIASPPFRRAGLIIVAPDHPAVRKGLAEAQAGTAATVQLVSRIGGAESLFVGIDNYAAGRTAAYFMARAVAGRSGSLVALCHSGQYEVHRERIRGFSDFLAEHPIHDVTFDRLLFGLDEDVATREIVAATLHSSDDIIGLYSAGGGDAGVAAVLARQHGRTPVRWVGHELTNESRRWLASGLMDIVLDQSPEVQARRAVDLILKRLGLVQGTVDPEPVRFLVVTRENL